MLVLASDFDGTLKQNGIVSQKDIDTILKFQAAGNKFGLVTGRSVNMVRRELEHFNVPFDFLVCNNGAIIADQNYQIIHRIDPDFEAVVMLIDELTKDEELLVGVSDGDLFTRIQLGKVKISGKMVLKNNNPDLLDWHEICQPGRINSVFMRHQDVKKAWDLSLYLNEKYAGKLNFHFNHGAIDVTAAEVDKRTGILLLSEMLNSPVAVIGDGHNDLPMIEAFDGYAVTAAPEDVKSKAAKVFDDVADCLVAMMNKVEAK